jgi:hypothetical protein
MGKVRSLSLPLTVSLGSAGPVIGGLAFDYTGSYTGIFWALIAIYFVAAILLAGARPPVLHRQAVAAPLAVTPVPTPTRPERIPAAAFGAPMALAGVILGLVIRRWSGPRDGRE